MLIQLVAQADLLKSTRIAAVTKVIFVIELIARDGDLSGIDHDHEITRIYAGSVRGFMLTQDYRGDFCRQTTQGLAFRIQQKPFPVDVIGFRYKSFLHNYFSVFYRADDVLSSARSASPSYCQLSIPRRINHFTQKQTLRGGQTMDPGLIWVIE